MSSDRPNIVLVILDSLRGDHVDLDLHGKTPNLARLAQDGLVFERAVPTAGWTLPSHVSMLTGLMPSMHGVVSVGTPRETLAHARRALSSLARAGDLLPDALASDGYVTFLGSANVWVGPASGLGRSFESAIYESFPPGRPQVHQPNPVTPHTPEVRLPGRLRGMVPLGARHRVRTLLELIVRRAVSARNWWRLMRWARTRADKGSQTLIDGFARWLDAQPIPFFAMFNLIETHEPHIPPGDRTMGMAALLGALRNRGTRLQRHNWGTRRLSDAAIDRLRAAYAGEVAYADSCVGRIVDELDRRGLREKTVVIVGSDHGEAFGEGGLIGHGFSLGEPVARTVWVMRGPGIRGERVAAPVSLSALASTVWSLARGSSGRFPGEPLTSTDARGAARIEAEPAGLYFRPPGMRSDRVPPAMLEPAAAFYSGSYKLVVGSIWGRALYDLDADPTETRNLIDEIDVHEVLLKMEAEWRAAR